MRSTSRGDTIKISAVDFVNSVAILRLVPPPTWQEILLRQTGTAINGGVILLVAFLGLWFGVRPLVKVFIAGDGHWRARWLSRR